MTSTQWEQLKRLVRGETPDSLSTGFIIDSPGCQAGRASPYLTTYPSTTSGLNAISRLTSAFRT